MDVYSTLKKYRYAEWILIALTIISQLTWVQNRQIMDGLFMWSTILACLVFGLAFYIPKKESSQLSRMIYLLSQLACLSLSCALGAYRLFSFSFLALVVKSALLFNRTQLIIFMLLIYICHAIAKNFGMYAFGTLHRMPAPNILLERLPIFRLEGELFFLSSAVALCLCVRALVERDKSRSTVDELNREVGEMAIDLERTRIARDMHDTLGHTLTSLNIQLELTSKLLQEPNNEKAQAALESAREIAKASLQDVRKAIQSIRNDDFNLKDAVIGLTEYIREQQDLNFDLQLNDVSLPPSSSHNLFCIIQESLTNIRKHAHASQVTISLQSQTDTIKLTIQDNGKGLPSNDKPEGFGVQGMKERAEHLGGKFIIDSAPGKGTSIIVTVPTA